MAIVRWEPFRELLTTQDRFNQLFNQSLQPSIRLGRAGDSAIRAWAPAVDIYETEHNLVIKGGTAGHRSEGRGSTG